MRSTTMNQNNSSVLGGSEELQSIGACYIEDKEDPCSQEEEEFMNEIDMFQDKSWEQHISKQGK